MSISDCFTPIRDEDAQTDISTEHFLRRNPQQERRGDLGIGVEVNVSFEAQPAWGQIGVFQPTQSYSHGSISARVASIEIVDVCKIGTGWRGEPGHRGL